MQRNFKTQLISRRLNYFRESTSEHGTIIPTEKRCKKIPFYMHVFLKMLKHFEGILNFLNFRACKKLKNLDWLLHISSHESTNFIILISQQKELSASFFFLFLGIFMISKVQLTKYFNCYSLSCNKTTITKLFCLHCSWQKAAEKSN